jgi:hypothetical protein
MQASEYSPSTPLGVSLMRKGSDSVVAIGVRRGGDGCDQQRPLTPRPRGQVEMSVNFALTEF